VIIIFFEGRQTHIPFQTHPRNLLLWRTPCDRGHFSVCMNTINGFLQLVQKSTLFKTVLRSFFAPVAKNSVCKCKKVRNDYLCHSAHFYTSCIIYYFFLSKTEGLLYIPKNFSKMYYEFHTILLLNYRKTHHKSCTKYYFEFERSFCHPSYKHGLQFPEVSKTLVNTAAFMCMERF